MASKMFHIDRSELRKLTKFYKDAPRLFSRAAAGYLNSVGFGTRSQSLQIINRRMTIRDSRFIQSSIRVQKARPGQPLAKMHSEVGTIVRERFTGLREQEEGTKADRSRVPTLVARGSDKQKKVKPSVRMKSANQFMSPDDFKGKNAAHRVVVMLQVLARRQFRKPFLIKGHRRFRKGLYQFKQRKLRMVQSFEPRNSTVRRVRWLTGGTRIFFRKNKPREVWDPNIRHVLKQAKVRKRR